MPARRRSNGSWIIDFRTRDGQRIRKTLPGHLDRHDVQAVEDQLRARQHAQEQRQAAGPTVGDLMARYWQEHGMHLASYGSESAYLERWSDALGDTLPVAGITADRISQAVARWRSTPELWSRRRVPRRVTNATINHRLRCLQRVMGRAADLWGWQLPRVPWQRLRLDQPEPRSRSLTSEQAERYMAALPERARPITMLALATGLRRGALLRLTRADLDFEARVIHAVSKGRAGGRATPVPMTSATDAVLGMMSPLPEVGRLFRISRDELRHDREKARTIAGLPTLRGHDLRHTFAQRLQDAGVGDAITAALHHSDPRLRKRYSEVRMDQTRDAIERSLGRGAGTRK